MAVVFEVSNAGSTTESYRLRCIAEAGVTACRLKETAVTIDGGGRQLIPVWYEAEGNGRVRLEASGRGVRDTGQYVIEPQEPEQGSLSAGGQMSMLGGGGSQAPYVTGHPAAGSYTSPMNVMLEWCGPEGPLEGSGRWVKLNGTTVTGSFSFSSTTQSGCADAYESSGSIALQSGVNNLVTAWICYEPPATQPDCGGGQAGVYQTITTSAPVVVIDTINPGTRLDRGGCVISDAGPAAAFQCGDLLVTHSMPAYKALNKDQTLTLLYNSSTAKVQPVVMANVYVPSGSTVPNSFQATLAIPSRSFSEAFTFSASGAGTGVSNTRRLAVSFPDNEIPTGVYPYTLTVTNLYGSTCSTCSTSRSGDLIVVNRSESPFGAGWSIAGVEQIYPGQRDSALLLVGGDGSAAVYEPISYSGGQAIAWRAPAGAYRDTIRLATYPRPDSIEVQYYRDLLNGTRIEYNLAGRQTWATARTGQKVEYAYANNTSDAAQLNYVQIAPHSAVKRYTLAYDGNGKLDDITDPAGRVLQATVTSGDLVTVLDPGLVYVTRVEYGYSSGLLASRRSPGGHTATYAYVNRSSQLATATMPATQAGTAVFTFTPIQSRGLWQSSGTATLPVASATLVLDGPRTGDASTFWVNRWNAPSKITDPLGAITLIERTDGNVPALPTKVEYHSDRVTRMIWNSNGTLHQQRDSAYLAGVSTPAVTTYGYHPTFLERYDSITAPDGTLTRFSYHSSGLIDTVTGPTGHQTAFTYDTTSPKQGLISTATEKAVETWIAFDSADAAQDQTTTFEYDALGNLTRQVAPDATERLFSRDAYGRVENAYDEENHRTRFVYDVRNRTTQVRRYTGSSTYLATHYHYGPEVLDSVLDPRSVKRSYEYDELGRMVAEFDELGVGEHRALNLIGLPDSITTRNGHVITNTYDALGRVEKRKWPAWVQESFTTNVTVPADSIIFSYSINGWLDSMKTSVYKVINTYHPNGLIIQNTQSALNGTNAHTNNYAYDLAGRRIMHKISATGGSDSIWYSYDTATGELEGMDVRWRNSGRQHGIDFEYDALGRRKRVRYMDPSGMGGLPLIDVIFSYDKVGNQRRICSDFDRGIVTDPVLKFRVANTTISPDRLIEQRDAVASGSDCPGGGYVGGSVQHNEYDVLHQLVSQSDGADHSLYVYDESGNMEAKGDVLPSDTLWTEATIWFEQNQLARWGSAGGDYPMHYEYHPDGSRQSERVRHRTYPYTPVDFITNRYYFYDALGRTTGYQRYVCTNETECTDYMPATAAPQACKYGPDGNLWISCSGNVGRRLGYDGANIVRTDPNSSTGWTFVHGPGVDDPMLGTKVVGSTQYYYFWVTDGAGRLLAVGDSAGENVAQGAGPSQLQEGEDPGAIAASYGFAASRDPNPETPGLSFFRNRFYDQATGRWTQEDPLGIAGGINLYGYAGNNPVTYTDPFGLCPTCAAGGTAGAVVGTAIFPGVGTVVGAAIGVVTATAGTVLVAALVREHVLNESDDRTADEIISSDKKGSIRREFPAEMLGKTQAEINALAKEGSIPGRKAKKLLGNNRFNKDDK